MAKWPPPKSARCKRASSSNGSSRFFSGYLTPQSRPEVRRIAICARKVTDYQWGRAKVFAKLEARVRLSGLAAATVTPGARRRAAAPNKGDGDMAKILVIDDDVIVRETIIQIL